MITAAVLAITALAAAGVPKLLRERANAPKTLAEMLEADGRVVVVDDQGKMAFPVRPLDPNAAGPISHSDGYLQLDSAKVMLAEIGDHAFPYPVRLSADVEMMSDAGLFPSVGIYCHRAARDGSEKTGPINLLVLTGFEADSTGRRGNQQTSHGLFGVFVNYSNQADSKLVPLIDYRKVFQAAANSRPTRHLSLTMEPASGKAYGVMDRHEFDRGNVDLFDEATRLSLKDMHIRDDGPLFSGGFGVYAVRSIAAFRNVVLEKVDR